jgi:hypothetical protein
MHGHAPGQPAPHPPDGLGPIIGYQSTREPGPLEDRPAASLEWWETVDDTEPRRRGYPPVVRITAAVLSLCLVVAGVGTVLDIILASR